MGLDAMGLKSKVLQELLAELEDHDGRGIKPRAAEVSMSAVKPSMEMGHGDDDDKINDMPSLIDSKAEPEDDDDEDLLRKLLASRMGGE